MDSLVPEPIFDEEEEEDDEREHILLSEIQLVDDDGQIIELESDLENEYFTPVQMPQKNRRRNRPCRKRGKTEPMNRQNEQDLKPIAASINSGLTVKTESIEENEGVLGQASNQQVSVLVDVDGEIKIDEVEMQNEKSVKKCTVCQCKADSDTNLVKPSEMQNVKPVKKHPCTVCQCKAESAANLVKPSEKTNVKPVKKHPCTVCHYTAHSAANLVKHFRLHTGEKPFACSLCSYCCSDRSSLYRHERYHVAEGTVRFICPICDFKCTESTTFVYHHQKTHIEKPFSCGMCSYRCSRSSYLKRHTANQHDPSKKR